MMDLLSIINVGWLIFHIGRIQFQKIFLSVLNPNCAIFKFSSKGFYYFYFRHKWIKNCFLVNAIESAIINDGKYIVFSQQANA